MEPLDLTITPPREPRATLLGLKFLPRTIDKLRAELPGGNIGAYLNHDTGFSAFIVRRVGLDMGELRDAVASAPDETALVTWLRERLDDARVAETNAKLESFTVGRMKPEDQVLVRERHPVLAKRADLDHVLDVLDADDRDAFAGRR